jgi:hypothetical protein
VLGLIARFALKSVGSLFGIFPCTTLFSEQRFQIPKS